MTDTRLCANPDCTAILEDDQLYCGDYCQREAFRIHGRVMHATELDVIVNALKREFGKDLYKYSDLAGSEIKELVDANFVKAFPFWVKSAHQEGKTK